MKTSGSMNPIAAPMTQEHDVADADADERQPEREDEGHQGSTGGLQRQGALDPEAAEPCKRGVLTEPGDHRAGCVTFRATLVSD